MTMKTKRIASLLLSAALLLSLAVPAFAENPTTEETAEPETAVQEVEPEALTEDDAVAPVAEPTAKKEYTYVAIGDSVTAGVGLSGLQYKLVQNGFDMSGNYKGYDGQCFVGYVADQLGLDRDHAINLGPRHGAARRPWPAWRQAFRCCGPWRCARSPDRPRARGRAPPPDCECPRPRAWRC